MNLEIIAIIQIINKPNQQAQVKIKKKIHYQK